MSGGLKNIPQFIFETGMIGGDCMAFVIIVEII